MRKTIQQQAIERGIAELKKKGKRERECTIFIDREEFVYVWSCTMMLSEERARRAVKKMQCGAARFMGARVCFEEGLFLAYVKPFKRALRRRKKLKRRSRVEHYADGNSK